MRWILFALCLSFAACGAGTTANGSGADTSGTDVTGNDVADASADAAGADTAAADADDVTATDAVDAASDVALSPVPPKAGTVWVNEVNAGGNKSLTAAGNATDGDWFELYNAGAAPVDLTGCKVGGFAPPSATNGFAGANTLPDGTTIPGSGFLVIYYNHVNLGTPNVNGGIKSDGSMALWDATGAMIDSIDWNEGASPPGASYDRIPDGAALWQTTTPPTPGKPNGK